MSNDAEKKTKEELDAISESTAEAVIANAEAVAEKVVAKDDEKTGEVTADGNADVPDDVVAEHAERRKRAANNEGEVRAINEAEEVRLTTESTLPDTPTGMVQVATTDERALGLDIDGDIRFDDGVATVTPEQAAELKEKFPRLIRIL